MSDSHSAVDLYVQFRLRDHASKVSAINENIRGLEKKKSRLLKHTDSLAGLVIDGFRRMMSGKVRSEMIQVDTQLRQLRSRLARYETEIETIREVWREMGRVAMVKSVSFNAGKETNDCVLLVIETEVLYSKDKAGVWHVIGQVRIGVPLESTDPKKIVWTNMTKPVAGPPVGNYHDGHGGLQTITYFHAPAGVKGEQYGIVSCFGTALAPLQEAMKRDDHVALVQILVRYTECTGQHDNARFWPVVKESEVPQWYLEHIR
jgi:hypothetical protein